LHLLIGVHADGINVSVNGNTLDFDVAPVVEEGRTLVPLRAIFEELGAEISWDGETKTIKALKDKKSIELQIGSYNAKQNGEDVVLEVPAKIINGRTMVPIRFVSEAMDCVVGWDGVSRTVAIRTANVLNRNLNSKMILNKEDGPYIISENFKFEKEGILEIGEGVEIYLAKEVFVIQGLIKAEGTQEAPIVFKSHGSGNKEIYLVNDDSTFESCVINSNIKLDKANGTIIKNSVVDSIQLANSNYVTIIGNTVKSDKYGIELYSSDHISIKDNNITGRERGITLKVCENVVITNNVISDGDYGIYSNANFNSKIIGNDITNAKKYGLMIFKSSIGNEYYYNNFVDNYMNVRAELGANEINLFDNYWGATKTELIEKKIMDSRDDQALTKVNYVPFLETPHLRE